MKKRTGTIWGCGCNNADVGYDQCTPQKPYESHIRKKVVEHEKNHRACVKRHEDLMGMAADVDHIFTAELRIGEWGDWSQIFAATKAFSKFVHEHQGIYRRSFFICGASDDLEAAVKWLLWHQTKEGKLVGGGTRWLGKVYNTLNAIFDDIRLKGERRRFPKESLDTRFEIATKLLSDIKKEMEAVRKKFPTAEGVKEVFKEVDDCSQQMKMELRQSHKESP